MLWVHIAVEVTKALLAHAGLQTGRHRCVVCVSAMLLLAGYADGSQRMPKDLQQRGAYNDQSVRGRRWRLPTPSWFVDLDKGLPAESTLPVDHACLLVGVSPGLMCKGQLTPWDNEAEMLWNYMGRPQDAYTMRIDFCYHMPAPVSARGLTKSVSRCQVRSCVGGALDVDRMIFSRAHRGWSAASRGPTLSADELREQHGVSIESWSHFTSDLGVLWVPAPVLRAIGQGLWRTLMFRASWDDQHLRSHPVGANLRRAIGFPDQGWLGGLRHTGNMHRYCTLDGFGLQASHANRLVGALRRWAPAILRDLGEEEHSQAQFELEDFVSRLSAFATPHGDRPYTILPVCGASGGAGGEAIGTLVETLLAVGFLRNRGHLKDVLQWALPVAFPSRSQDEIEALVRETKLLDHTTVSRKQVLVDAMFCRYWPLGLGVGRE